MRAVDGARKLEQQELEENDKVGKLDLSDRKYKYTREQLVKFLEFKAWAAEEFSEEELKDLKDNHYCRFLEGYVWEKKQYQTKIAGFIVSL